MANGDGRPSQGRVAAGGWGLRCVVVQARPRFAGVRPTIRAGVSAFRVQPNPIRGIARVLCDLANLYKVR
jgi:hypothetical protein